MIKICKHCGKEFESKHGNRKYCTKKCYFSATRHPKHSKNRKWSQGGMIFFATLAKGEFYFTKPKNANSKSFEEWQKEADELHLDYGNYRAQVEIFGKSFEELKSREM